MKYIYIYIFLITVILLFSYYNSLSSREKFTPHIRRFYRPHLRNTRIYAVENYNNLKQYVTTFFRKIGITK